MACERPHPQLWLYLDGELVPPEALDVAQHLRICPTCQREVAVHRRLQALLRTVLPEEDVPAQLWTAIQHRLAQESPPTGHPSTERPPSAGRPRHLLWMCLGTLAALALIAVAVRFWFTPAIPVSWCKRSSPVRFARVSCGCHTPSCQRTQRPSDSGSTTKWSLSSPCRRYHRHAIRSSARVSTIFSTAGWQRWRMRPGAMSCRS